MDCSKAMLALGSIYEKGIADETQAAVMMGALQRKSVQENSSKAFEYYDRAAEQDQPFALFKLGQFMEQGKYEEGYNGV